MQIDRKIPLIFGVPEPSFLDGLSAKKVFVAELRPGLEGMKITAKELLLRRMRPVIICDNMLAYCMQQGKVEAVHIFYRALDRKACLCRTGSLIAALCARKHRIPLYLHPEKALKTKRLSLLKMDGINVTSGNIKTYAPLFEEVPYALMKG